MITLFQSLGYAVKVKGKNFNKNGIANIGYDLLLMDKIYCGDKYLWN